MRLLIAFAALGLCANIAYAQDGTHISIRNAKEAGKRLMIVWSPDDGAIGDVPEATLNKSGYSLDISKRSLAINYANASKDSVIKAPIEFLAHGTDPVVGLQYGVANMDLMAKYAGQIILIRQECQSLVGLPKVSPYLEKDPSSAVRNPATGEPLCGEAIGDLEVLNKFKAHVAASIKPLIDTKQYKLVNQVLSTIWPQN